jgi:hypothetical protein
LVAIEFSKAYVPTSLQLTVQRISIILHASPTYPSVAEMRTIQEKQHSAINQSSTCAEGQRLDHLSSGSVTTSHPAKCPWVTEWQIFELFSLAQPTYSLATPAPSTALHYLNKAHEFLAWSAEVCLPPPNLCPYQNTPLPTSEELLTFQHFFLLPNPIIFVIGYQEYQSARGWSVSFWILKEEGVKDRILIAVWSLKETANINC